MISGRYITLILQEVVPYLSVHVQDAESFCIKIQFNHCTVLSDGIMMIIFKALLMQSLSSTLKREECFVSIWQAPCCREANILTDLVHFLRISGAPLHFPGDVHIISALLTLLEAKQSKKSLIKTM